MSPSTRLYRPYYYGAYKWDNYALDIAEACEANARVQRQGLLQQSDLLRELADRSFDLEVRHKEELSGIRNEVEEIKEAVRYGFSVVVDRLDEQIKLFSDSVSRLEAIHSTLKAPRATEAEELFRQGEYCFQQGLFEESLDAFLRAEEIYRVNYLLQFRIGSLFLEGRNRKSNVIDVAKSERHFLLAVRYAEAEYSTDPQARYYAGDAYFRAAKALYVIGEQHQQVGNREEMTRCLHQASEFLSNSSELWPKNTATVYYQAKCHALLGQRSEALNRLSNLSDRNRAYYADIVQDGDFRALLSEVEAVFKYALECPGPNARAAGFLLEEGLTALNWAKRSCPESSEDRSTVFRSERLFEEASRQLGSLAVDIEGLMVRLTEVRGPLEETASRRFGERLAACEARATSLRNERDRFESAIAGSKREMSATQGSYGVGCGFVVLAWVLLPALNRILVELLPPWKELLRQTPFTPFAGFVLFLGIPILIFWLGFWLSRWLKNKRLRDQANAARAAIDRWNLETVPLINEAEAEKESLKRLQTELTKWRAASVKKGE